MHMACFWRGVFSVSVTVAVCSMRLCMHMCAHGAVQLLHAALGWTETTAWADLPSPLPGMIEIQKLVVGMACCSARLCFTQVLTSHVVYF